MAKNAFGQELGAVQVLEPLIYTRAAWNIQYEVARAPISNTMLKSSMLLKLILNSFQNVSEFENSEFKSKFEMQMKIKT